MNKCYGTDDETFRRFPTTLEVGQIYYEADYTDINIEDYSSGQIEHLLEIWMNVFMRMLVNMQIVIFKRVTKGKART